VVDILKTATSDEHAFKVKNLAMVVNGSLVYCKSQINPEHFKFSIPSFSPFLRDVFH
jgi:hypothetical protein